MANINSATPACYGGEGALLTLRYGCGNLLRFIFKGIPASPKKNYFFSAVDSDIRHSSLIASD